MSLKTITHLAMGFIAAVGLIVMADVISAQVDSPSKSDAYGAAPFDGSLSADLVVAGTISSTCASTTLGAAATTFAATRSCHVVTGDAGSNTLATITGGIAGDILMMMFVDANITITDTDAHTANTVDLTGAATDFTSSDDDTLTLISDGTSWYELSRGITGGFSGPGSSTDNAIVRFDGAGGATAQNSVITVADTTGALAGPSGLIQLAAGEELNLPLENDAVTPTLRFGDGDTGLYEASDDALYVSVGGSAKWAISDSQLGSSANDGGYILQTGSSATVPSVGVSKNDTNNGIGYIGTDSWASIAGGMTMDKYVETSTEDWANHSGEYMVQRTLPYGSFVDGGGLSGTLTLGVTIPDGSYFKKAILHTLTGYTGGANSTAVINVGTAGDPDRYNTGNPDVYTSNASGVDLGAASGALWHDDAATVIVTITVDNDFSTVAAGTSTLQLFFYGPMS